MNARIEFRPLKAGPPPIDEPLLVRGEGEAGKPLFAIAKYSPNQFHDGWLEYRYTPRNDGGDALLWFRPSAWAALEDSDPSKTAAVAPVQRPARLQPSVALDAPKKVRGW